MVQRFAKRHKGGFVQVALATSLGSLGECRVGRHVMLHAAIRHLGHSHDVVSHSVRHLFLLLRLVYFVVYFSKFR